MIMNSATFYTNSIILYECYIYFNQNVFKLVIEVKS
jgi:hypothetical protein